MKGDKSILEHEEHTIEVLVKPNDTSLPHELVRYPTLPVDTCPAVVHYKSENVEVEITDIREGNVLEGILFGKVTITDLHDGLEDLSVTDENRKGKEFTSDFYVPLLDSEKIIEYLLDGLDKDDMNHYQVKWFEHLQQALRPCNDYTLRNAAYNEDPVVNLLEVEGYKTIFSTPTYNPTFSDVANALAKALQKVNAEFDGRVAVNTKTDTDLN